MTKILIHKWLIVLLVCGLTVSACGKDSDPGKDNAALSATDSILRFIPAGTPYVLANTTPLSDEMYDHFEPKMDAIFAAYQNVFRAAIKAKVSEMPADAADKEQQQFMTQIMEELMSLLSVKGIRDAGIGRDSTFAIYGNGLLPVIRIQLSDAAAFEAAIARIEEKAGNKLETAELAGKSYRYVEDDNVRIVVGVFDNQAVLTIAPVGFNDTQLSQLTGLTLPAKSIAASGELRDLAKKYDFTNHYLGLFSPERIVDTFIEGPSGLDADVFALFDNETPQLSDICKAEFKSIVAVMPRVVLGYSRIDTKQMDSSVIFELRDDIALGLSTVAAPVAGLGADNGGMMSFGFGLNPKALREFYEARIKAMEAEPYKCEMLQELQAGVASGRELLQQPIPPMVYDFRGFLAIIDDMSGMDLANNIPPTSVSARVLIAMDNVQALVAMGSMFSPELAQLNLQPDSKAVPLALPQVAGMVETPFVAMSDSGLAIAVGEGSEKKAGSMLSAPADAKPPFMAIDLDAKRYYAFIANAMSAGEQGENQSSPEMMEAMQEAMILLGDLYERMLMEVRFTNRGVEMDASVQLAD